MGKWQSNETLSNYWIKFIKPKQPKPDKKTTTKKKGIKIKVKSLVRMIKSGSGTAAESLLIFVGKGLHKVPENIPP